ncbi:hypothetical protein AB0B01_29865 [Streptomyces sp. NPDC044571]|uniref:hypothetical protein n=1 Tax=Streptomyces sp. NPDC044571 TaxID=3155371 RepID=UPI00340EA35F
MDARTAPPDAECRFEDGTPIGEMSFVRIRDYTRDPAWEAADSYTGDIEKIVSVCTDPAYAMTPGLHWSPEFEERIDCPAGDLLIMDRVRIQRQWRGFGIGALAAAEAIRRLVPGCCAVACEPAPTDGDFGGDEPGYQAAQAKIARVWESVGFKAFNDGVYLLDPALQHPSTAAPPGKRTSGGGRRPQAAKAGRSRGAVSGLLPALSAQSATGPSEDASRDR